jgi:hypothetical protein
MPERIKKLIITVEPDRVGFEKLSPSSDLFINGWQILVNPKKNLEADFWIVYGNARSHDIYHLSKENTLLVVLEPESKKVYPKEYYKQFQRVIDTHKKSGHPRILKDAPCFPWHVGLDMRSNSYRCGYTELKALPYPKKILNQVSVICSSAAHTSGQRDRLAFLRELKIYLGENLVHFGRGFRPLDDKMDGIYGYRFHLCMENCSVANYCTEKLIDSYLGWSFPLYWGCVNVDELFPPKSLIKIDIGDPVKSAQVVKDILNSPISGSEEQLLDTARKSALEERNPFVYLTKIASRYHNLNVAKKMTTIRSHKAYRSGLGGLVYQIKSSLFSSD